MRMMLVARSWLPCTFDTNWLNTHFFHHLKFDRRKISEQEVERERTSRTTEEREQRQIRVKKNKEREIRAGGGGGLQK